MDSSESQTSLSSEEEEDFLRVMQLPSGFIRPMILKAVIELDLFGLMAKAGPDAQLSATEIVSHLPTRNQEAPFLLERMLQFLASFSYLSSTLVIDEDGHAKRLYSLAPICKYFLPNQDGASLAPLLLLTLDKVLLDSWYGKDSRFNEVFNKGMHNHTSLGMKRLLQVYSGFEGVERVVDVGGGYGATLACIISKYPNIQGINFDLPYVIKNAPAHLGVKHVGGDMFESVPEGDDILLKWILHDWGDDGSLKLLKNCWKAVPYSGKVIVVESVLPENAETDLVSTIGFQTDLSMMIIHPGGKERTAKEFEVLAKDAGFTSLKFVCRGYSDWVMELYKT